MSFVWSLFSLSSITSTGEFSSRLTFIISFSSPVDSILIFGSDNILSIGLSVFPARSPLASLSFRSVQDISGDPSMFQLVRGCHFIQIFQLFRCTIYLFNNPFQRCFSLQWALTHRSFPRILPDSSDSPGVIINSFQVGRKNEFHQSHAFSKIVFQMLSLLAQPLHFSFSRSISVILVVFLIVF